MLQPQGLAFVHVTGPTRPSMQFGRNLLHLLSFHRRPPGPGTGPKLERPVPHHGLRGLRRQLRNNVAVAGDILDRHSSLWSTAVDRAGVSPKHIGTSEGRPCTSTVAPSPPEQSLLHHARDSSGTDVSMSSAVKVS